MRLVRGAWRPFAGVVLRTLQLGPLDYAVVTSFVALILALGFSARLRANTSLQMVAAGRALSLPLFVATLVSTWYGGILGITESVSYYGLGTLALFGVPYYIFALVYAGWYAGKVRDADQISIPERLAATCGKSVGLLAGSLVFLLAVPAAHVLMLSILVRALTGWDTFTSLWVGAVGGSLFLYRGGLLADARASIIAFVGMYAGFAAVVVYCLVSFPVAQTWSKASPALLTWNGGASAPYILSFLILGSWTLVDPGFHQRVASAADGRVARRGLVISVVCWFIFDLLSISAAMYAVTLGKGDSKPLELYPAFADRLLPTGLKGLFFCGMIGVIVSAMVGYALVAGASLGRDLAARTLNLRSEPTINLLTRAGIFLSIVAAVLVAGYIPSVVGIWYLWSGALIAPLLLPVTLSYFGRTCQPAVTFLSIALSFAVAAGWLIYAKSQGNDALDVVLPGVGKFSLGTLLPGLLVSGAVLGGGRLLQSLASRVHTRN